MRYFKSLLKIKLTRRCCIHYPINLVGTLEEFIIYVIKDHNLNLTHFFRALL